MEKYVCMFVWNHFTNDARVMRECITLSSNGYKVDLICIDDPYDSELKQYEQINKSFEVYRVRRYPIVLTILQKLFKVFNRHKWLFIIAALVWLLMLYKILVPTLILTTIMFVLYLPKIRKSLVNGSLIFRMIAKGYKSKYDIYHSNDLNTMPQGYVCSKLRFNKKKLIYDSHEVQTSRTGYNSPLYGKLESFYVNKIDAMIVENHTRAAYNEKLYGFYPNVLHNYPFKSIAKVKDKMDIHSILNIPSDEKILLYQGGIQVGRGLEKIIEATPMFVEGTVVFIGDGNQKEELIKLVERKNLQSRIRFLPKIPLGKLPKYTLNGYLGFQVLNNICFNHWSASSNKLFEYMMAQVPVVACSFPEIKKVVKENEVGICVDSHDPKDIARGVNELLLNKAKRNQMSQNCIQAQQKYNWELEGINLIKIYNNI